MFSGSVVPPPAAAAAAAAVIGHDEAAELAAVTTMIMTTSPIPTCPAIDMISITLDSIYRNPQMRSVRLLLVCDGCKVQKQNAFRSGRVTADAYAKYVQYKANLRAEIESQRYPCVRVCPRACALMCACTRGSLSRKFPLRARTRDQGWM